jgi:hypothetical protein
LFFLSINLIRQELFFFIKLVAFGSFPRRADMKSGYEGLGIFYLGREYDIKKGAIKQAPLLYD